MANSPVIFNGRRSKLLTADGLLTSAGRAIDYNGSVNYIANGHAEVSTAGWANFNNATLTTGTGGSSSTAVVRTTSSPLRGQACFSFTSGLQGDGISYDFSIDSADQAKVLQISFDYSLSAAITDGDFQVWIYDVTNAALIQPSSYKLSGTSGTTYKFSSTFQTASNSTAYRLIIWQAASITRILKFDNLSVSPQVVSIGGVATDGTSFTPSGSWVSNTTYSGKYWRVGDKIQVKIRLSLSGAPTAASLTVNMLPSGLSVDTSKLNSTATDGSQPMGTATIKSAGGLYDGSVYYNGATSVAVVAKLASGTYTAVSTNVNATTPATFASGDSVEFFFEAPISGWGTSQVLSSETDTRVITAAASGKVPTGSLAANFNNAVVFGSVDIDNTAQYNTSTGRYTAVIPGFYSISAYLNVSHASIAVGQAIGLGIYSSKTASVLFQNFTVASSTSTTNLMVNTEGIVELRAGDYIEFRGYSSGTTPSYVGTLGGSGFAIQRISGPSQIAASESVNCRAYLAANQTGVNPNNTYVKINFDTRDFDTHSAWDTTNKKFTAPIAGKYRISCSLFTSTANVLASQYLLAIYKNGSLNSSLHTQTPSAGTGVGLSGSTTVSLVASDYLEIYLYGAGNNSASTITVLGAISASIVSIERIGN